MKLNAKLQYSSINNATKESNISNSYLKTLMNVNKAQNVVQNPKVPYSWLNIPLKNDSNFLKDVLVICEFKTN